MRSSALVFSACPNCGCTDVEVTGWVHANTGVASNDESPASYAFCPQCDDSELRDCDLVTTTHEKPFCSPATDDRNDALVMLLLTLESHYECGIHVRTFNSPAEARAFREGIELVNDGAIVGCFTLGNAVAVVDEDQEYGE